MRCVTWIGKKAVKHLKDTGDVRLNFVKLNMELFLIMVISDASSADAARKNS